MYGKEITRWNRCVMLSISFNLYRSMKFNAVFGRFALDVFVTIEQMPPQTSFSTGPTRVAFSQLRWRTKAQRTLWRWRRCNPYSSKTAQETTKTIAADGMTVTRVRNLTPRKSNAIDILHLNRMLPRNDFCVHSFNLSLDRSHSLLRRILAIVKGFKIRSFAAHKSAILSICN